MIISYRREKVSGHLVLVRHGESQWNAKGLWTGWEDVPLSKKGKEEARLAAQALVDFSFHFLVSSDLKRAYETLEIIRQELRLEHLPIFKHHAYRERHYGIFTGKNKWEIRKKVGEKKFKKIRRGWDEPIPEGETLKDVYERAVSHFREHIFPKIIAGYNVLLVAHGNTHRAIIKHLENLSDEEIEEVELETGEVIIYRLGENGKVIKKERRKIRLGKN